MTNYVGQFATGALSAVNVAVRAGAVLATLQATPYLMELAARTLKAGVNALPESVGKPLNTGITFVQGYLPVQPSFDAKMTKVELAKNAMTYLGVAAVSVFLLNRSVGSAPAFYNNAASGLGKFLVGRTDVLQLVVKKFV